MTFFDKHGLCNILTVFEKYRRNAERKHKTHKRRVLELSRAINVSVKQAQEPVLVWTGLTWGAKNKEKQGKTDLSSLDLVGEVY